MNTGSARTNPRCSGNAMLFARFGRGIGSEGLPRTRPVCCAADVVAGAVSPPTVPGVGDCACARTAHKAYKEAASIKAIPRRVICGPRRKGARLIPVAQADARIVWLCLAAGLIILYELQHPQ